MVGEVRKHGHYYPACRAKCEPLLDFLLHGIPKQNNPILKTVATHPISIVFEDDHLMVIEKPSGLLSVPGRSSMDSVEDRLRLMFPHFPFLKAVHRLDLGTSGLMVIAKNEGSHTELQRQFEKRKVEKKYLAILEGSLSKTSGEISLPLRLNLEHRPHQMVCFEHGKKALTTYKVLSTFNNQTRILFTPTTGRTHQLRVHAAHPNGLNCPILGDELYGNKKDRLYLHASYLSFQHPTLKTKLTFDSNAPF
jgi:tRNA pseudouridine32 synthase/23S rRNA pseudouridine746 synthase